MREFLADLPAEQRARVTKTLDLLEEFGTDLGMPDARPLEGKLWELRVRGGTHHRVIYVAVSGRRLVLLHGFTKKTTQTPRREITTAQRRLADWTERERARQRQEERRQ